MDATAAGDLRRAYRTNMIIGIAMLGSVAMYAVLAEMVRALNAPFRGFAPFPGVEVLRYGLLALSAANFFAIRFLRDRILSGAGTALRAAAPAASSARIQRLSGAALVAYALCESVTIYGLLLFLLAGSRPDLYGFMAISLVLYAIYFPRYAQWEQWVRGQERGRIT